MSSNLRIFMLVAEIIYFVIIFSFLKKKTLQLKYTFLWLFAGVVMVFFTAFPGLFKSLVRLSGVKSAMNGLFAMCIFFIIIILMSLTSIVSKQSDKIRKLIQENAILEKRIRDIENNKDNENDSFAESNVKA